MKPDTAAKKLGIYLPAAPEDFRSGDVTRDDLAALKADPPEWLVTLRQDGPHPRIEVARRLGVSNSGLARAGVADVMTTAEIKALLDEMPEWLRAERETHAGVIAENVRLKAEKRTGKPKPRGASRAR
ncbi:MAG: hypothetical protein JWO46_922 [Nocardioidaceae bacterium]|nr:hypothetical protein [Nocardioidaceae bacterium]